MSKCSEYGQNSFQFMIMMSYMVDVRDLHMQRQTRVRMMIMAAATDAPTATASTLDVKFKRKI